VRLLKIWGPLLAREGLAVAWMQGIPRASAERHGGGAGGGGGGGGGGGAGQLELNVRRRTSKP
jgi:hypothetical protein